MEKLAPLIYSVPQGVYRLQKSTIHDSIIIKPIALEDMCS